MCFNPEVKELLFGLVFNPAPLPGAGVFIRYKIQPISSEITATKKVGFHTLGLNLMIIGVKLQ